MKKILITGATGFIGSHLTELLVKKGNKVLAFDQYNSSNSWNWLEHSNVKNDVEVILGDVRDYSLLNKCTKSKDVVIHLAALISIPYSYHSPLSYIKTNIEGTFNVLEASKNHDVEQTLITSTSETFGSAQYIPIDENHPLVSQSPYASSKIAADQLAISYINSFDMPIKIVRPFNTYGPRQSMRAVIPSLITQMLNNKTKIEVGNLYPKRDLTFVTDTCEAFVEIIKCKKLLGQSVNVGTNYSTSILQLINKIKKILNYKCKVFEDKKRKRPKKSEVDNLICDNKKIKKLTKWRPKTSLDEGLNKTIEWFKKNYKLYNNNRYNF